MIAVPRRNQPKCQVAFLMILPTIEGIAGEIGRALDSDVAAVTWLLSGYFVAAAVFTPLIGRLGDMLGKRRRLVLTLVSIAVVLLCLVGTYYFWFRDSQFVAVERVAVEGVDGPGSEQITAALTEAAGGMTTLHVRQDELDAAVAGFPTVIGVEAEADFPRGLTITVNDRPPTMLAKHGGRVSPIAADGTVMAKLLGAVDAATLERVVASVSDGRTVSEENDRYRTGPGS